AGVIAGYANSSTIENCITSGSINAEGFFNGSVGGVSGGENSGTIKKCINYTGINVISQNIYGIYIGGIAGKTNNDYVTECGNYGDISVSCIDSTVESRALYIGGISGDNSNISVISDCFNRGNIDVDFCMPSICVGGITGNSWSVMNSYNTGKISVPVDFAGYIGGISGDYWTLVVAVSPANIIKNLYYINEELTPTYVDGVIRDDYDFDSENIKLLTEDEFKKQESFAGFDFESVWEMEEDGYPVLKNQPRIPQSLTPTDKCGENVYCELNKLTGFLRIYGSGEMDDYDTFSAFDWHRCSPWFYDRDLIKNVVIEEGVTSIGSSAFESCNNLISVDMAKSIKSIGYGAFANCYSLENIVIPEGVETIDDYVFWESGNLKTVSISKTVKSIGEECFYFCNLLEKITVDSENECYSSDEYGVLFNKDKTDLIRYPSGSKTADYTLPESVVRIETGAFSDADSLENVVFNNGLKSIYMEAFWDCDNIKEVALPGSLTFMGQHAFYNCNGIKSLTVADGAKSIGTYAFRECTALETIILPDTLEEIGWRAFDGTVFVNDAKNWEKDMLYCGKNLIKANEYSYPSHIVIEPGTTLIAERAFSSLVNITEITIPDSLKHIGASAFSNCNGLASITIPETVISLGRSAFSNCENLETVEINANIKTIESNTFSGCTKLKNVILSDTITSIDYGAFTDCDSLETVELPENLETIGRGAFESLRNLTVVNFPESLVTIGDRAFYNTNISSAYISKNVTTIGNGAFACTPNLTKFEIDEENEHFKTDGKALYSNDGTRLIYYFDDDDRAVYVIPEGVTNIDDGIFYLCQNIEAVTIPITVEKLYNSLFDNCTNLKSVAVDSKAKTIGTYMFDGCTSLEKVYFSSSVKEFYHRAFDGCPNISDIYFGGTEEEWNKISGVNNIADFENATIHYNHTHSHSLDELSNETYPAYGYRLYSCECGHYYTEYDNVSKSDKYDVTATYHPDCFDEEVTLEVETVSGDREPGGVYVVDGKTYIQVGIYNIKAVNDNGEAVQPNEGHKVKLKIAIPEEYKDKTDMVIYHRFVDGGREKLSTADGTLVIQDGYMIFEISKFSEFEILAGTADMTVSKLPQKLKYRYRSNGLDLGGIQLKITDIDGSVEYVDDISKMTVEGFDSTKVGTQTVTVRYGDYTCTFEVEIYYAWWQWIIRIFFWFFAY
ncbi:MAG: leucine-rich repeat domain-containing protein, partial [Acutalibacteraceae bacterium]|nr:leucine-rich repeat domain-containing protein [Acutalibacteraceae bacterium]